MIFAELHDKLGTDYSRAHERAEDLLTSTVFGLFRYLPTATGLLTVLRRACIVRQAGDCVVCARSDCWAVPGEVGEVKMEFWPHWGRHGQPDVLLSLYARGGAVALQKIVVEAKLFAMKSGEAGEDDPVTAEDRPDPDQLVRYWQGLQATDDVRQGATPLVIYLTRHTAPPMDELAESLRRSPIMKLAWLSWCDFWQVAHEATPTCLPAADVARLLAHKGLKYFTGFGSRSWRRPASAGFWNWFASAPPRQPFPRGAAFWRQEE